LDEARVEPMCPNKQLDQAFPAMRSR
jgi:hypothetical protein